MDLSYQNVANHTAAPVGSSSVKMLQTRPLFYQFMQIILLHLHKTVPNTDHHSVSNFFTNDQIMPFAHPHLAHHSFPTSTTHTSRSTYHHLSAMLGHLLI
jgi:hypothetical protein